MNDVVYINTVFDFTFANGIKTVLEPHSVSVIFVFFNISLEFFVISKKAAIMYILIFFKSSWYGKEHNCVFHIKKS